MRDLKASCDRVKGAVVFRLLLDGRDFELRRVCDVTGRTGRVPHSKHSLRGRHESRLEGVKALLLGCAPTKGRLGAAQSREWGGQVEEAPYISPIVVGKADEVAHVGARSRGLPISDCCDFAEVHSDAALGDDVA